MHGHMNLLPSPSPSTGLRSLLYELGAPAPSPVELLEMGG